MSMQKLLYVFTQAPYSNSAGLEALDAVLIGAAFEQDISVLFIHNGVFQLNQNQSPNEGVKQFTKTYKALEDFGVDSVYVDRLSMASRGLDLTQLICPAVSLEPEQVTDLLSEQYRVFTF